MPRLSDIVGHPKPIAYLSTLLDRGNIPHALLFTGPVGVGKHTTARALAMALNCRSASSPDRPSAERQPADAKPTTATPVSDVDACGTCRVCRKIESGQHPDIILVKPDGPLIRISQIRELRHQLAMRPYEGRMRVVIIADAHTMNPEAANALLKALEEPPADNLFVLTTSQTSDLLPTIVSRCQQVYFGRLAASEIAQLLTQQGQVAAKDAEALAMLAQGSMAKAVDMSRKHGLHRREWLIAELEQLHNRPINALLALSERLALHKDTLDAMLEICQTWFRDLLVYSLAPATIINKDMRERIQRASERSSRSTLVAQLDAVAAAQDQLRANANARLTLDVMVLRLAGS